MHERTRTGVERLRDDPSLAGGHRAGLVTNHAGVLPDLTSNVTALMAAGIRLTALFAPEHGLWGTAQAGASEAAASDPESGLPVYDTYRRGDHSGGDLDRLVAASGIDVLLFDLADVGTRYYTYIWTMHDLLISAARLGIGAVILDRPNPIGGMVAEGPLLDPAFASFVGRSPIPIRHGLTVGELAQHLNIGPVPAAARRPADLRVIAMTGWGRSMYADQTGLPWVLPSVNIPTLDTALVYPGTGLFEGTNLSEGRGTTRPFELIAAPYADGRGAAALNERELPGVRFRDAWFTPTFHKYSGDRLRGVQVHVTDRRTFAPVRTGVTMLATARTLYPDEFGWHRPEQGRPHFVDLLWGSDHLRHIVDRGGDVAALAGDPMRPSAWAAPDALLYD